MPSKLKTDLKNNKQFPNSFLDCEGKPATMNNSINPLVSIVTLNYDHPEVTCALLASLRLITYREIEIIVIDNASPKEDPTIIHDRFPEIIFMQNDQNQGFAGGNNQGIRRARGKYILLLNNDTEVDAGFLEPLVAKLEANANLGAVSPKIKFFDRPDTIQFTGQSSINRYTMRNHGFGWGLKDTGQFESDASTAYVHGAATLVPIEVIRKVGLMPDIYFLYYEELDWCTRMKHAGYELEYVHNSTVYHKVSLSVGKNSILKTFHMNKSRLLYLRRNIHGTAFLIACLYLLFVSIPKNLMVFLMRNQMDHCKAYCRAIAWHTRNLHIKNLYMNPTL